MIKELETLISRGATALDKLVFTLKNTYNILEGSNNNTTVELDHGFGVCLFSKLPGYEKPGVGFKSLIEDFKKEKPLVFSSPEEIDSYIKKPKDLKIPHKDLFGQRIKEVFELAQLIPPNQIWQGDVLFVDSDLYKHEDESSGDSWTCFQQNTLTYVVPNNSDLADQINNSKLGIVFYSKQVVTSSFQNMKQSFNLSLSELGTIPESLFIIIANDFTSSDLTFNKEESDILSELISLIEQKAEALKINQTYEKYLDDKDLQDFIEFSVQKLFNKNKTEITYQYFLENFDKLRQRWKDSESKTDDQVDHIRDFIEGHRLEHIIDLFAYTLELKSDFLTKVSKILSNNSHFEQLESTFKGIAVADVSEKLIKFIDRSAFENLNFNRPIRESTVLNERVETNDKISLYTSSKSENLFDYYTNRELRFGQNAGLEYGHGSYFILDPPNSADSVGYTSTVRDSLYGSNIYQFYASAKRVFFLLFEEFQKTSLCAQLKSTFETFIDDQIKYFKLSIEDQYLEGIKANIYSSEYPQTAKSATLFYGAMKNKYYQNANGTLNTPINGFIYRGKNDGEVAVIWEPYSLTPHQQSNDGGVSWKPFKKDDPAYKEYLSNVSDIEEKGSFSIEKETENKQRMFGNHTEEKETIYRLLVNYDGTTKGTFLGNFTNIKINDDKTIDATYKSNLPQNDGYKHYYRVIENEALKQINDLGYRFGTLNCGIKFGSESAKDAYTPLTAPDYLLPQKITKGICLVKQSIESNTLDFPFEVGEKLLRLEYCTLHPMKTLNKWELEFNPKKPCFATDLEAIKQIGVDTACVFPGTAEEYEIHIKEQKKKEKEAEKALKKKPIKENLVSRFLEKSIAVRLNSGNPDDVEEYVDVLSNANIPDPEEQLDSIYNAGKKGDLVADHSKESGIGKTGFFYVKQHDMNKISNEVNKSKVRKALEKEGVTDVEMTTFDGGKEKLVVKKEYKNEDGKTDTDVLSFAVTGGIGKSTMANGISFSNRFEELLFLNLASVTASYQSHSDYEQQLLNQMQANRKHYQKYGKIVFKQLKDYLLYKSDEVLNIDSKNTRVYYVSSNYTLPISQVETWVKVTNATASVLAKSKKQMKLFRTNVFIFKKADIVLSIFTEQGILYIPISVKINATEGNGGDFSCGNLTEQGIDFNYVPRSKSNEEKFDGLCGFLSTVFNLTKNVIKKRILQGTISPEIPIKSNEVRIVTQGAIKCLNELIFLYSGGSHYIFAYYDGNDIQNDVLNETVSEVKFVYKGQQIASPTRARLIYPGENNLSLKLEVGLDNGKTIVFGETHTSDFLNVRTGKVPQTMENLAKGYSSLKLKGLSYIFE